MNRLFGSKPKAPKPTLDDAITGMDSRVASLDVKLAKLNGELGVYQQKLAAMRDGPGKQAVKQRALRLLQQRKQIEAQRDQLQAQSWSMEQAQATSENLRSTMVTLDAMKTASKELKKQYGKVDIDKIEAMQDEMADLLDLNADLQDTLSRGYAVPDDVDEAELDAELDVLGQDLELEGLDELTPSYATEQPAFVDEPPEAVPATNA